MLLLFFLVQKLGLVYDNHVPVKRGNSALYVNVLKHLSNAIQHSRPEKWGNNQILHHENMPCHTSLTVQQFLVKNQIPATPNHHILLISLCA
jgi:hypothetical protein